VWDIYKRRPGLVLGFHGCDKTTGEAILTGKTTLKKSANDYDWRCTDYVTMRICGPTTRFAVHFGRVAPYTQGRGSLRSSTCKLLSSIHPLSLDISVRLRPIDPGGEMATPCASWECAIRCFLILVWVMP
jgi:hypothetical protein